MLHYARLYQGLACCASVFLASSFIYLDFCFSLVKKSQCTVRSGIIDVILAGCPLKSHLEEQVFKERWGVSLSAIISVVIVTDVKIMFICLKRVKALVSKQPLFAIDFVSCTTLLLFSVDQ